MKAIDLIGCRFGRLVAVECVDRAKYVMIGTVRKQKPTVWRCMCDCGAIVDVAYPNLTRGHTASCGCLKSEGTRTTHGKSKSPEHKAWLKMRERCSNATSKDYPDYGGRGISVDPEWAESFEAFYRDMGSKPSGRHSVERINVDGDYEKANCVWATPIEQANNKRDTVRYQWDGESLTIPELCRRYNKHCKVVRKRIRSQGWSLERALSVPCAPYRPVKSEAVA